MLPDYVLVIIRFYSRFHYADSNRALGKNRSVSLTFEYILE